MSGNPECHFYVWAILAFLVLALVVSLLFNISYYVEKQRQRDKTYRYSEDYIPSIFYFSVVNHDLFNSQEPMDENCYEQMKARPERSVNQLQEATAPAQATNEARMFYASLAPSQERKHRKPRKHDAYLSDKDGDEQLHARKASLSKTSLVDSFPPESQAVEEDIHDDPIRLFGLIRAKKEPTNQMDYDLAQ
ncbi:hypothetical protein HPG69_010365 [Diceros bicornis minor]|uniref:T-cell receptor-associated transmembrane adapter 1 n=1 Tax=Diceros bicornis minor TaxID=77932 RepID=A0A7J7F8C3_DICBM|nr:hypothetical protein HPG69_010365 [Diceros bicornis minor]